MKRITYPRNARQTGSVLIISLIMLVVLTLIGISMIRLSTTNLQLVNNMQGRHQALAAANAIINQVLSTEFVKPPNISSSLDTIANATYTYSPEGEDASRKDYTVTLSKPCLKSLTVATGKITGVIQPNLRNQVKAINTTLAGLDPNSDPAKILEEKKTQLVDYIGRYQTCLGDPAAPCYLSLWQFTATVRSGFLGARTSISAGADVILGVESGIAVANDSTLYCSS